MELADKIQGSNCQELPAITSTKLQSGRNLFPLSALSEALKYLKLHYRFFGIVIIAGIGIYLIGGLAMIAVAVFFT